jgi:hypothetical protein
MTLENLALLSRRSRLGVAVVILALIGAAAWTAGHFLQPAAPRHIVLASGLEDGLFHQYAKRYVEILARSGVTVEERMTAGAGDNLRLLEDPHSGVDIASHRAVLRNFPKPMTLSCFRTSITCRCGFSIATLTRSTKSTSCVTIGSPSALRAVALAHLSNPCSPLTTSRPKT